MTALDLIPLIIPEYSNQFLNYTKSIYQNINENTKILAISMCTKNDVLKYNKKVKQENIKVTYLF